MIIASSFQSPARFLLFAIAATLLTAAVPSASAQDVAKDSRVTARQAYDLAEGWVRRLKVAEFALEIEMDGLVAVYVTLRKDGITLGQGVGFVDDPGAGSDADMPKRVDLMPLLQKATRDAIRDAAVTLRTPNGLVEVRDQLVLDVQFGVNMQRVRLQNLRELPTKITLDADGLAMRRGPEWAWVFPGNSVATNANLKSQINRLLGAVHHGLDKLAEVGQPGGPELYRFDVVHVVRPTLEDEPVFLHRGNELLPAQPIMDAALDDLLEQMIDVLLRKQREDGFFAGTYHPTSDIYEPAISPGPEMAVAAFALARASRLDRLDLARRTKAKDAARRTVVALIDALAFKAEDGANVVKSPAVIDIKMTSLLLLALMETPEAGHLKDDRLRFATTLSSMLGDDGWFRNTNVQDARPATMMDHTIASLTLVRLFEATREPTHIRNARRALDTLWTRLKAQAESDGADARDLTETRLLPWLTYAETDLVRLGHGRADRVEALVALGDRLWNTQVKSLEGKQPDTIGGFMTTNGLFEEPTWQTAPVLAGQAVAMRSSKKLAEDDKIRWLVNAGMAARFIKQLTMGPKDAYYVRNRQEAIGAVRVSLWDNAQPLYTTSMSLLALAELKHALTAMGG